MVKQVATEDFLTDIFATMPPFNNGEVWLAGAGPGRIGMLTLECIYAIKHANHIVYDALINQQILSWASPDTQLVFAGKRGGVKSIQQDDITDHLIAHAQQGKKILRLKGGDPVTFARGGEEALKLNDANIPFRILPGITAGIGGLAAAGIPLTQRESNVNVMFLTGHALTGDVPHQLDWQAISKAADVMVWYMAVKHFPQIAENLLGAGRDPQDAVAFVSHASLPNQQLHMTQLQHAADISLQIAPPAIIAIGPIVTLQPILQKNFLNW